MTSFANVISNNSWWENWGVFSERHEEKFKWLMNHWRDKNKSYISLPASCRYRVFIWIDLCVHGGRRDTYATIHVWRSRTTFGDRVSPSTMWAPGIELGSLGLAAKPLLTEPPCRTQLRVSWVFSAFSITRRSVLGCPCPSEESFGSQIYQPLFQISSQLWFHFFFAQESFSHDFPFYSRFILTASEVLVISIAAQTACVWNALFLTLRFNDPVS